MNRPAPHERMLATLLAVGEAGTLAAAVAFMGGQVDATPLWWNVLVVAGAGTGCVLTALAAGGRAPAQWGPAVYLGVATTAMLTLPLLSDVDYGVTGRPWVEPLIPWAVAGSALMSRSRRRAVAAALLVTLLHGWLQVDNGWRHDVDTVVFDSVYIFTLFLMLLAVLMTLASAHDRVRRGEQHAVDSYVRARATEQLSRRHSRWDALVHDELLVALEALTRADAGDEARRVALAVAEKLTAGPEDEPVGPVRLREELLQAVLSTYPLAETRFEADPVAPVPVPDEVAQALLSATSEALRNAAEHAYPHDAPGPVELRLRHLADGVTVVVADEGSGFRPDRVAATSFGVALSMENRMDAVGGLCRVESSPGDGTRVALTWARGAEPAS